MKIGVSALIVGLLAACSGPTSGSTASGHDQGPVTAPGCSTDVAPAGSLHQVSTTMVSVPGNPFGVATTSNGQWSFVSLDSSVAVFSDHGTVPTLIRQITVPGAPAGETFTHDGRYLLVATGSGAVVIDVAKAEHGASGAVIGMLSSPGGDGAIEVVVSPDDDFAFVTLEYSDAMAVFNLRDALTHGFGTSDVVGTVPLEQAAVGMAVAPDGQWIYATSEQTRGSREGTVSVIGLDRAETDPAHAVASTVMAGCSPVRVITSSDGSVVWVTARGSDELLAFAATRLVTNPAHALLVEVRVGEAPVGLALIDNGHEMAVADSNRFSTPGHPATIALVDTHAALAGAHALLGVIPAGLFPREMAVSPDGRTLLVTNYSSQQVEVVSLTHLP